LSEEWRDLFQNLLPAWKKLQDDVNQFRNVLGSLEENIKTNAKQTVDDVQKEELERALGDITLLNQWWQNYSREVSAESRSANHFRNQLAMGLLNPHSEGGGITLATIHAVKGLEYNIVFIMGFIEGVLPDYRAKRSGEAALAEEKNDAFVAITRSKRHLYLSWPRNRFMPWDKDNPARQNRSRFLDEIIKCCGISETPSMKVAEDPKQ
jgi:DNA helicase-2/ATP-dependent DNA helicase PcrA